MASRKIDRIIIIDSHLFENKAFISSLENFNVSVQPQYDLELYDENEVNVIYVSSCFEGPLFDQLLSHKKPVISDLVVNHCLENRIVLPFPKHPLFNYCMKDFIICFSTNDKRQTKSVNKYLNLIRFMGGQSRRDMKSGKSFERTHLIESTTDSDNYKFAMIYGIPILNKEWIDFIWENRRTPNFEPANPEFALKYKLKPFMNLKICLQNFPSKEAERLTQDILNNDGEIVPLGDGHDTPIIDKNCTHLVINNSDEIDFCGILEKSLNLPKYVVTSKWLSACLETLNREDEEIHKLKVPRLEENNSCHTPTKDDSLAHQTLNSILLSPNYDKSFEDLATVDKSDLKKQAIIQELYQTEANYVSILKDILKVFREPLKNNHAPNMPNEIELKTIFSGLPPIIEVHEKILSELESVVKNWDGNNEVGKIFQKHSKDFLTVYPQYVNFYEQTTDMIAECTGKYPQFSKFLRACQTLPECRKQTFQELLINPIQRLPRIQILLEALLSKTNNLHPDYKLLNEALSTIKTVNSEINQEKKKTEGQMEMFDIVNDIEDCPATLLSSNRHFISKCDARLLIQTDSEPKTIYKLDNYVFSLLLFSDLIMLCKKRMSIRRANSLRERSAATVKATKTTKRAYKYIETIDLRMLKIVHQEFDDTDFLPDSENAFVYITYPVDSGCFVNYPFVLTKESETKKQRFINDTLQAYQILMQTSNDDHDVTVTMGFVKAFEFSHSKIIARNLNRPKYVLMKTKEKINRTFSYRRSTAHLPSSVSMENLNSSILSRTPSASKRISRVFNFLTPKENHDPHFHLNARKMGSINDLSTTEEADGNFSLPTTPAPRKKKFQESNS